MVGTEWGNFANLTCPNRWKLLSQTSLKIFLKWCIKLVTGNLGPW